MNLKPLATVFYEDGQGQSTKFGPHNFLMACLCDLLQWPRWEVEKRFPAWVAGGNTKLRALLKDLPVAVSDGRAVVAIFDEDRIRGMVGLPHDACKADVLKGLRGEMAAPERVTLVLLERNVESLLRAIQECDPLLADERAVKQKKKPNARDLMFASAAAEERSDLRTRVLERVPSFARARDALLRLAGGAAALTSAGGP